MPAEPQFAGIRGGANADVLQHLAASLEAQCRQYCKRLAKCQKRFSEEAVHKLRVELRRLMATLELLCAFLPEQQLKKARHKLKSNLDLFDRLRDTQVQMAQVRPMVSSFTLATPFLEWLARREARFACAARRAVKHIKTRRLRRRLARFKQEIKKLRRRHPPPRALATALLTLDRAFRRVSQCRRRIEADDTLTIHRTRIAFKRFRYMVEGLSPLLSRLNRKRCRAMHGYQSIMGDIQDMQVLLGALDRFVEKHESGERAARPFRRELIRRRQALIATYLKAADDLNRFWPLAAAKRATN